MPSDQLSIFDVAHARSTDPDTSHAAAASVTDIRQSQKEVWALFVSYGEMTDEELIERAHANGITQSVSGLRTRRKELVNRGLVRDSGERGLTVNGRRTIRWEVA